MKTKSLLTFILILAAAAAAFAQERFVKPVDEANRDASFAAFRDQLIKAVEARDGAFVVSVVDPKILLGYGGENGIANFKKTWRPERRNSLLWEELLPVLKNGGKFSNREFQAPYVFSAWPEDLGSFDYQAIFGSDVNLREAPSTDARVVTRLSYNVVEVDFEKSVAKKGGVENGYEWLSVKTLGGKRGFVKSEYVRSPIGYRAGFAKKGGKWKMTFFLAGD
jgi:hypothetical protein